MRAVEHWDDLLLTTWKECSDERAVLMFTRRLSTAMPFADINPACDDGRLDAYGILKLQASADSNFQKNNLIDPSPVRLSPEASCSARAQS